MEFSKYHKLVSLLLLIISELLNLGYSKSTSNILKIREGDTFSLQELAVKGEPVLLIGATKKWEQIVGKPINVILSHFSQEETFFFDVAPLERSNMDTFTFVSGQVA
jgi:hypothetical protein